MTVRTPVAIIAGWALLSTAAPAHPQENVEPKTAATPDAVKSPVAAPRRVPRRNWRRWAPRRRPFFRRGQPIGKWWPAPGARGRFGRRLGNRRPFPTKMRRFMRVRRPAGAGIAGRKHPGGVPFRAFRPQGAGAPKRARFNRQHLGGVRAQGLPKTAGQVGPMPFRALRMLPRAGTLGGNRPANRIHFHNAAPAVRSGLAARRAAAAARAAAVNHVGSSPAHIIVSSGTTGSPTPSQSVSPPQSVSPQPAPQPAALTQLPYSAQKWLTPNSAETTKAALQAVNQSLQQRAAIERKAHDTAMTIIKSQGTRPAASSRVVRPRRR